MKKLLLLIVGLLPMALLAQENVSGRFPSLESGKAMNMQIDMSQMTISSQPIATWLKVRQAEQPQWDAQYEVEHELKPQVSAGLVSEANARLEKKGFVLLADSTTQYTLKVVVINVERKGNNVNSCQIIDNASGRTLVSFTLEGKGGVFGSMSNLWGDGFRDAGKKLGKLLARYVKP
jgi:hypothetical protein